MNVFLSKMSSFLGSVCLIYFVDALNLTGKTLSRQLSIYYFNLKTKIASLGRKTMTVSCLGEIKQEIFIQEVSP